MKLSRSLSVPRSMPVLCTAQCPTAKANDLTSFTDGVIEFVDALEQRATIMQASFLRHPPVRIIEEQVTAVVRTLSDLRAFCSSRDDVQSPAYVEIASFSSSARRCKSIPLKFPLLLELLDMYSKRSSKVSEALVALEACSWLVEINPPELKVAAERLQLLYQSPRTDDDSLAITAFNIIHDIVETYHKLSLTDREILMEEQLKQQVKRHLMHRRLMVCLQDAVVLTSLRTVNPYIKTDFDQWVRVHIQKGNKVSRLANSRRQLFVSTQFAPKPSTGSKRGRTRTRTRTKHSSCSVQHGDLA